MRKIMLAAAALGALSLAGCGGKGDDKLGDQEAEAAENKAEILDEIADNQSGAAEDATEAQADATRAAGGAKEEAIDDADVNADAMSNAQKDGLINGQ